MKRPKYVEERAAEVIRNGHLRSIFDAAFDLTIPVVVVKARMMFMLGPFTDNLRVVLREHFNGGPDG